MNDRTSIKTIAIGSIIHNENTIRENRTQIIKSVNRMMTFTKRTKKLTNRPCQSYCPNMGTKILRSQIPGANCSLPAATSLALNCAARLSPPVYHHTGAYRKSIKNSRVRRCKMRSHIKDIIQ